MLEALRSRLSEGLDVVTQAGKILAASTNLPDSLTEVVRLCAGRLCDYAAIEISAEATGANALRVEAGTPKGDLGKPTTLVAALASGQLYAGKLTCSLDTEREEPVAEFAQIIAILGQLISVSVVAHSLSAREHRIADRLARALLPHELPSAPGFELSAAYRPASDEAEVGGDWYDAFFLPDGRLAISIGDVAGHGLDAAVVMGELRQTARAAAIGAERPAEVLEQINAAFRMLGGPVGMVTAIFATYDPRTNDLIFASAGHPPPVLALEDGTTWQLPIGGLPLGCADAVDSRDWSFTLPEGSTLYFYTDGLIENDRDLERGERELLGAIRTLVASGERTAEELVESIFAGTTNRDDAAALTLTSRSDVSRYRFSSVPMGAPLARAILMAALAKTSLDEPTRFGAGLAVTEAVVNAIEHGYGGAPDGLVRLDIKLRPSGADVTIEDSGRWRTFARDAARGRGLHVMQSFTGGVQIRSTRDSTIVALRIGDP
jgi:anti-sigma regulatory factor (Ser/Thr protein kinase)